MSATPASSAAINSAATTGGSSTSTTSGHTNKRQRMTWRGTSNDILPLRKYTPTPTSGTAPLHSSHDFGHTDFYPAKPGQNESQLSERTIRYGYVDVPRVDYEHASSHNIVYERLQDTRVFQELQAFAAGTAQRQWARGCIASSDLPRLPNRAVKSDERRDEWLRSLSNPRVPLSVLANSMPFGLRGERLLESLRLHMVPLQRAIWAIRLTGVYEMFGMQTRAPDHANLKALESQYTVQWSKQFTQFIEHTLAAAPTGATDSEGAAPLVHTPSNMAATPGMSNNTATPQANAPANWPRNWAFCLSLLHEQYSQGLLDQRHLVSWLVGQFRHTPVDKCMFILPLVRDYTMDVGKSRTPLRKLIGAVSFRIEQTERYPSLHLFHDQLCRYLIRLFTTFPDAFVEPTTWAAYRRALDVAGKRVHGDSTQGVLGRLLKQVEYRNSRFSCLVAKKDSILSSTRQDNCSVAPLRVLASLTPDSDIGEVFDALFGSFSAEAAHVIRLICYWAVEDQILPASTQFRLLAAAQLCKTYVVRQPIAASGASSSPSDVQRAVVGFLDIFPLPASGDNKRDSSVWRVCSLLERLSDVGSFSLLKYLQLLTARGDFFGTNFDTPRSQRHLDYVLHIPISSVELKEQRKMLLYDCDVSGDIAKTVDEDPALALLRSEISKMLPLLVAYTCATPLRARNSEKPPTIDLDIVRWWTPDSVADLLNVQTLPTAAQFSEAKLQSPLAHTVCVKDWIASLSDHIADEPALNRDFLSECILLLQTSPRNVIDLVINQRLLPIVYDYIVKDVKVGVDNWRVITRPGTSLLNRRQTAAVIRVLAESGLFSQLLDFLLWVLDHTTTVSVLSLSHRVLRRYTPVWKQLGKLPTAIAAIEKERKEARGGSETFDFELYRTAQYWASFDSDARCLAEQSQRDYDQSVNLQVSSLLYGGHTSLPASASKDILQLAQQLIRERTREPSGSSEAEWAITPCFQKIASWAQSVTQRSDFAGSPAMQLDTPNSPPGGVAARLAKLQAMLAHIVVDATQAALVTSRTLPLAPSGASDRAKDEAMLRCFVELCAQLVHWFAVCSGLAMSPDYIAPLLLKAMSSAIGSWTLSRSSSSNVLAAPAATSPLGHSVATTPMLLESEIEAGMHVAYIWVNSLLSCGCLRLDDLIPWLIEMCREEPTQQNLAQYTCLAGIMCALGMPTQQQGESHSLAGDTNNGNNGTNGSGAEDYSVSRDLRHMYELLEIGSCWQATLDGNRLCRIQAIELVFTNASVSGRLRGLGAPRLATTLMRATTALAQSQWIMSVVDHVPYSRQGTVRAADMHGPYYSMLEIYQANIEGQIHDPAIMLPVKRAILRVLMTLCEGADPAPGGFSAMTTAEVAHRLRETIRRFWYGPAAKGGQTAATSKIATILNSLLLFASTALQESEATTDAFAVAAGAKAIAGTMDDVHSGAGAGAQDIGCVAQGLEHDGGHVQFVTNTMAYLSSCVLDAAFNWGSGDIPVSKGLASRRCASLAEALCTLSPSVLLTLIESCVGSLLSLSPARLHTVATSAESADISQQRPAASQGSGTGLDERVAAIVSAFSADSGCLFDINTADYNGMELDDASGDSGSRQDDALMFAAYAERGSALAKLIQQLVQRLVLHIDTGNNTKSFVAGSTLAALRDLSSGILGQIQAICLRINPTAAAQLSLKACDRSVSPSTNLATAAYTEEADSDAFAPQATAHAELDLYRLRTALSWRLQAVLPMCNLFRQFPDEFGVSEWLITLVTLCLAPVCQPSDNGDDACDGKDELYQFLLDFAAITNECITPAMRKIVLGSLRLAAPLLRSAIQSSKCTEVLGRLFPFDTTIVPTSDIQPLVSSGLDNPWVWIESLEFVPLASLNSSAIANAGLEGITPFTLRGTLQQETIARSTRSTAPSGSGYGLGMRSNSATSIGSSNRNTSLPHRLQYLENPYFPMQPSFIFPLAETPIPWQLFGGKRRRLDMESRLVWRSLCESTFNPSSL
ncbi:hypothetical protein H4S04_001243 [Coemansia sp. S16]|nr:hypothetical protein GGI14_004827 [Coemansia sp. S680]KAJ2037863.1 hypothetical protein H4S03_002703 [Coemansia sp. S3946]KAJ2052580.1 hypothetical protein H4S04_001243 [Coemansia sp. S16]